MDIFHIRNSLIKLLKKLMKSNQMKRREALFLLFLNRIANTMVIQKEMLFSRLLKLLFISSEKILRLLFFYISKLLLY
jgi:hypothetical protein